MKLLVKRMVVISVMVMGATAHAITLGPIYPAGPQDGAAFGGSGTDTASQYGFWGVASSGATIWKQVGIHVLPPIPPGDVISAELRIPRTDTTWTGLFGHMELDWDAVHIDAQNDAAVTAGDDVTPLLGVQFGASDQGPNGRYRNAGPQQATGPGEVVFTSIDVTAAVIDDITSLRPTFAWRIEPTTTPTAANDGLTYFPTVENTDLFFGEVPGNHGARLIIEVVPEPSAALLLVGGLPMILRRRK